MEATTRDGVSIWWERTGSGPVVALVPGRGDSTDLYPGEFSDRLLAAGRSVLRFDPRDTGRSGEGGDQYTLSTLTEDLVTVLDASEADVVDLVGVSMGGMTLVDLASRHPERVRSEVFLSAMSPDPDAGMGEDFFAAIAADPVESTLRAMGSPTTTDREWVVGQRAAAELRAPARPDSAARHQDAAFRGQWPAHETLQQVRARTLVIHGTADRVLPIDHARALSAGIEGAELHLIDGMGHLPTPREWDAIATLVTVFLAG